MLARVFLVVAVSLGIAVRCGGKVLDGTCVLADGGDGWSCTSGPADASGVSDFDQCPPNFDPSSSCPGGDVIGPAPQPYAGGTAPIGYASLAGSDCFACGSGGIGTHWVCHAPNWKAAGQYECTR